MKTGQGALSNLPATPAPWPALKVGDQPRIGVVMQPAPAVAMDEPWQASASFRRALVELMLTAVEAWERSTGWNRLELAEKSRIWRVTVDDGRLRARAMERYLSLAKLPRHPRWREVLRSAYYVLGECALERGVREELQRRVDTVLAHVWRQALGADGAAHASDP